MLMKVVGYSSGGRRVGQSHHAARLTDAEVELMRQLYEAHPRGHPNHWSMGQLAAKFECAKQTVAQIVNYQRRIEATTYKRVLVKRK